VAPVSDPAAVAATASRIGIKAATKLVFEIKRSLLSKPASPKQRDWEPASLRKPASPKRRDWEPASLRKPASPKRRSCEGGMGRSTGWRKEPGEKNSELRVSYLAVVGLIHAQQQAAGAQQGQQQEQ
jgi:hypothetical protein